MDSTINRAHQHAAGARHGEDVALGRSSGGLSTKVHMLSDAHGNPQGFTITEGQTHDTKEAIHLVEQSNAPWIVADKGYDSQALRENIAKRGIKEVIPRRRNSLKTNTNFDQQLYKARHVVENLFARMKQFRGFATRFDKLKRNYQAVVAIVASSLWIKLVSN